MSPVNYSAQLFTLGVKGGHGTDGQKWSLVSGERAWVGGLGRRVEKAAGVSAGS